MNRFLRGISLYLLIAILAVTVVTNLTTNPERIQEIGYSQFSQWVEQGRVVRVRMIGQQEIRGQLVDGTEFMTIVPPGTTNLADHLMSQGVEVHAEREPQPPWWIAFLPNIITLVIFVGIWLFILNQMQGGSNRAMSFGKSRAKLHTEDKTKVRFDDVAGLAEAKQELVEIVEFLKHPKKFAELGAKIPKGVLLVGPPGTGKTLLARAVAGEAGVPFFSISGSDFVEMFVGVGASRVRDLFDTAKKNSPCIVFIDELDAVGRQRGAGLGGGHDEREQTLNQLLVEMDGFESNSGIIVMAATNRPDVLDPALLRPGRFDRKIIVDRADLEGREEILRIHARNKPLDDSVDLKLLAKRTPGFSGADLANLMNEAAILAARRGKKVISMEECEEAIDRVLMGPERKRRLMTERDKEVFAYHEVGHAVAAYFLPHCDPVHKVTIVSRGMAGGYTMTLPEEERAVHSRAELKDIIAYALGGRAAEEIRFGKDEVTTGAQNDLERVTKLARKMVMEWGMSDRLGHLTFGRHTEDHIFLGRDIAQGRNYSEEVAAYIDEEVRKIVEEGYQRAYNILKENWDKVVVVAEALKEKETLTREVFERLMQGEDLAAIEAEQAAAKAAAEASQTPAKPAETEQRAVAPQEREGIAKKTPPQPAMELE
ncbi:MAG TPA: ATP-dependent zinc metalloprotease FtsH [Limnochordia bacterium]|nr:ATP-dependent zinc metalloprotease FtsH [Limnochordia bacterium]